MVTNSDPELAELRDAARERARELRREGLSIRKIVERLSGFYAVGTVHRWTHDVVPGEPPPEPPAHVAEQPLQWGPGSAPVHWASFGHPKPVQASAYEPPPAPEPTVNDEAYRAQLRERLRAIGARAAAGDRNAIDEESKLALTLSRISKVAETTEEPAELAETRRELDFSKLDDVEIEVYGALRRRASDDPDAHPLPNDAAIIAHVTTSLRASGILDKLGMNTPRSVGTPPKARKKQGGKGVRHG